MERLYHEIRTAARGLFRNRAFSAVTIFILAVGIGANTLIFSFFNTVSLKPPASVAKPERLVTVLGTEKGTAGSASLSHFDYLQYRDQNGAFSDIAAYGGVWLYLQANGRPLEVYGYAVSSNYFSVLGLHPRLGRFFFPSEESPVALISYEFWQTQFDGDPQILGKQLRMNRTDFTVIGVGPEKFAGLYAGSPEVIWMPAMMMPVADSRRTLGPENTWLEMVGRLKDASTPDAAKAELISIARQLETAYPDTNKDRSVTVAPLKGVHPLLRPMMLRQFSMLMAIVTCVLLIVCANIAGLLLVRASSNQKAISIRLALGASRSDIMRQILIESMMLSIAGAMAGLLVSVWTESLLGGFLAHRLPALQLQLDVLTIAYALGLSLVSSFIFGLVPAVQATRLDFSSNLKVSQPIAPRSQTYVRSALVVAQIMITLLLLIAAGLLIRSVTGLLNNPGYEQNQVAHFRLRPSRIGYDVEQARRYQNQLLQRLQALPAVRGAVLASYPPDRGTADSWGNTAVSVLGRDRSEDGIRSKYNDVTPGYFGLLEIPLLRGRDFDWRDRAGSQRVAIVNQTLANRLLPNHDPIGMPIAVEGEQYTIIGIAKDIHPRRSDESPLPYLYRAYWQTAEADARLFVRVAGNAAAMIPMLRQELLKIDPDVHIGQEMTLTERTRQTFEWERLISDALSFAGALGLLLSVIGIYGLIAYAVSQRTREMGVRMALGAQKFDILRMVLGEGFRLVAIGLTLGMIASFALTRILSAYLYGVQPHDPITLAVVSILLAAITLMACYLPARRATRVDPLVALRYE